MGQITATSAGIITVVTTDRESGPGAGGGASGNRDIFLGALTGFNSLQSDLIAIGNNALSAGATDANLAGTVVIGSQAGKVLVNAVTGNAATTTPNTLIGFNAATAAVNMGGTTIIGANALLTYVGSAVASGAVRGSVIIGTDAAKFITGVPNNEVPAVNLIVIGNRALLGTSAGNGFGSFQSSVIIGTAACLNAGANATSQGNGFSDCVVIGTAACTVMGSGLSTATANTIIGSNACQALTIGGSNTIIGANTTVSAASIGSGVALGNGISNINNFGTYVGLPSTAAPPGNAPL